jgi:putative acetyltransferase
MIIRKEKSEEFSKIYDLVKVAFQTAKVTNGKEQDFVNQLRSSGNYIPELALVAEGGGEVIGHIMLTKTNITSDKSKYETLFLGPISVILKYRNKGVGSKLIIESLKAAKAMGFASIVLVGDPAYYHRFGFKASINFGIRHVLDIPEENVMACELFPKALHGTSGTFDC